MKKQKLIQARKQRGVTQREIAEILCMDVSNYNRKEKGKLSMRNEEWEKIAEHLGVPVEEIYEEERQQVFICKDQAVGIGVNNGTNNVYTIPEFILDAQRKYIQKLEKEIEELKKSKD
jgi:transcriptional regulator with XRE-family HTH domain